MALNGATMRLGSAVASRAARSRLASRSFTNSSQRWAAQNFVMPALSPTMTEGNISKWNVKEGDSFSAGDVLLDIETDKAQMDVEAQDDGVLAKIMQPDGTKGIKVGTRIAVMAEEGDNLSSLEIPAEESKSASSADQPKQDINKSQENTSETPRAEPQQQESSSPSPNTSQSSQKYPLYPAVQALLRENGVNADEAQNIPASGPQGRLLKGDVLSYLGKIQKGYSAQQSTRISDMGHLDLSNIQKAAPKPQPNPTPTPSKDAATEPAPNTEVAVSISLGAVLATQTRIKDTLGLVLPLSTFIARASEIANEGLPRAKQAPTADELYDAVLGLDKVKKTSRGRYSPNVTALADRSTQKSSADMKHVSSDDVIDVLTGGNKLKQNVQRAQVPSAAGVASASTTNVFSVSAKKGEEKRVRTYLERMKTVLEAEPGRCVL